MSNKANEVQEVYLENNQISKIAPGDVMAIKIAANGAMGEPGGVIIFMKKKNQIIIGRGNYTYGNFDIDAFLEHMKADTGKDFMFFVERDEAPEGWNFINMGMGNNLYVRNSYYKQVEKKYKKMLESDIYGEFYNDLISLMKDDSPPVRKDIKIEEYKKLCNYVKRAYKEIESVNEQKYTGQDKTYIKGYEACDEINLWTYWQGRGVYQPKIMLFGQDWGYPFANLDNGMAERLDKCKNQPINPVDDGTCHYFDDLDENRLVFKTDNNLAELFRSLGMGYDDLLHVRYDDLFFTNVCLGYRNRGNSGNFKKSWITDVEKYVYPELIDILQPKVIICLGKETYEGFLCVMGKKDSRDKSNFNQFIEENNLNPYKIDHIPVFVFAHCGSMGTLNRNNKKDASLDLQKQDWNYIKKYL